MSNMKCPECGCIIPPDLSKCPNCGRKDAKTRLVKNTKENTSVNGGITMGRIGYAVKCEIHGKIHITATVGLPPTKCPFC